LLHVVVVVVIVNNVVVRCFSALSWVHSLLAQWVPILSRLARHEEQPTSSGP